MTVLVNMVAPLAMLAAEVRLTGLAVEHHWIMMGFPFFCTWYEGLPLLHVISPLQLAKRWGSLCEHCLYIP